MLLSADPQSGVIARSSADLRGGATRRSSANLSAEALVPSTVDRISLHPKEASVRSAEDLRPEDLLERSVADVATVSAIDNEIDKLTEELAAFCLDQLEKNIVSSYDDVVTWDLNMTAAEDTFEDESRVRDYIVITR